MKLISHRGNINGIESGENSPDSIINAINLGYDVEIDVWVVEDEIYLGHDNAQYKISLDFLIDFKDKLWIHAKNIDALLFIDSYSSIFKQFFWHQNDDVTLTSNNYFWTFPGKPLTNRSIAVKPETVKYTNKELKDCYGICSDYIINYK